MNPPAFNSASRWLLLATVSVAVAYGVAGFWRPATSFLLNRSAVTYLGLPHLWGVLGPLNYLTLPALAAAAGGMLCLAERERSRGAPIDNRYLAAIVVQLMGSVTFQVVFWEQTFFFPAILNLLLLGAGIRSMLRKQRNRAAVVFVTMFASLVSFGYPLASSMARRAL